MRNLKARLQQDGSAFGSMVMEFLVPGMPAIVAATGADFALFDMEHTGATLETMKAMVAGCRGIGLAPLVRVPRSEYHFIARALDIGAHGVMVPMVGSPAEAAHIAACAHYPPAGRRGAAFGVAHDDYRATDPTSAMAHAERPNARW
jgi:2-keto-3-deoxy-L-rhamnonate aldolase RhmA